MSDNRGSTSAATNFVWGCIGRSCALCKKDHKACNGARPCSRCISMGWEAECRDVALKPRGRPRKQQPNLDGNKTNPAAAANSAASGSQLSVSPSTFVTSFPFLASAKGDLTAISEKFTRLTQKLRPGVPTVSSGLCNNVTSPRRSRKRAISVSTPPASPKPTRMCCDGEIPNDNNTDAEIDLPDDKASVTTLIPFDESCAPMEEGRTPYEMVFRINLVGQQQQQPQAQPSNNNTPSAQQKQTAEREVRRPPVKKTKKRVSRTKEESSAASCASSSSSVKEDEEAGDVEIKEEQDIFLCESEQPLQQPAQQQPLPLPTIISNDYLMLQQAQQHQHPYQQPPPHQHHHLHNHHNYPQQQQHPSVQHPLNNNNNNNNNDNTTASMWTQSSAYGHNMMMYETMTPVAPTGSPMQTAAPHNTRNHRARSGSGNGSPRFMFLTKEPLVLNTEERLARNPYFIKTPPQVRRTTVSSTFSSAEIHLAVDATATFVSTFDGMEEEDVWF